MQQTACDPANTERGCGSIRHDPSVLGQTLAALVPHRDVPSA
jgi:hypothetical protein